MAGRKESDGRTLYENLNFRIWTPVSSGFGRFATVSGVGKTLEQLEDGQRENDARTGSFDCLAWELCSPQSPGAVRHPHSFLQHSNDFARRLFLGP